MLLQLSGGFKSSDIIEAVIVACNYEYDNGRSRWVAEKLLCFNNTKVTRDNKYLAAKIYHENRVEGSFNFIKSPQKPVYILDLTASVPEELLIDKCYESPNNETMFDRIVIHATECVGVIDYPIFTEFPVVLKGRLSNALWDILKSEKDENSYEEHEKKIIKFKE